MSPCSEERLALFTPAPATDTCHVCDAVRPIDELTLRYAYGMAEDGILCCADRCRT